MSKYYDNAEYGTGYSGQTLTEDFQKIRDFIIVRGNSEKNIHDRLFKEYHNQIFNPDFKDIFQKYYDASKSPGLFKGQQAVLEKHLKDLHLVNQTILIKDKAFAERLVNEKGYAIHITLEAQELLKGGANYSTEVAAKEAAKLRESLQAQYKEITELKKTNLDLSQTLNKVNMALTNLVGNLKAKLGFTDEKINDLMNTKVLDVEVGIGKAEKKVEKKDNSMSI